MHRVSGLSCRQRTERAEPGTEHRRIASPRWVEQHPAECEDNT
jgi:hypothetical protein